jgi:lipid-A-disaccharide synthase
MKARFFALPNLLEGDELVPEFFQQAVTADVLAGSLRDALLDAPRRRFLQQRFRNIHLQLRQGGAARAAQVVMELLAARGKIRSH